MMSKEESKRELAGSRQPVALPHVTSLERPPTSSGSGKKMLMPHAAVHPATAPGATAGSRRHSLPSPLLRSAVEVVDLDDDWVDPFDPRKDLRERQDRRQQSAARRKQEERAELERLRTALRQEKQAEEEHARAERDRSREICEFNRREQAKKKLEESRPRSGSQPGGLLYRRPDGLTELQKLDILKVDVRKQMVQTEEQRKEQRQKELREGMQELRQWRKELDTTKKQQVETKHKQWATQKAALDYQVHEAKLRLPVSEPAKATDMPALEVETKEFADKRKKESLVILKEQQAMARQKVVTAKQERERENLTETRMVKSAISDEIKAEQREREKMVSRSKEERQYFSEELRKKNEEKAAAEKEERERIATGLAVGERRKKKRMYVHPVTDIMATGSGDDRDTIVSS